MGVLLFFAAYACFALAASACVGLALRYFGSRLEAMDPGAQSRVLLAAAFTPAWTFCAVVCASVANVLISGPLDVCRPGDEIAIEPSFVLIGVLLLVAAKMGAFGWMLLRGARDLWSLRRRMPVIGVRADGAVVTAGEVAQAFVTGVLAPRVYVTEKLLAATNDAELRLILAHEQSHVARRDPMKRVLAALGCVLHFPSVAKEIQTRLARAQELAADDHAAKAGADRLRLAELILALARQSAYAVTAIEFAEGNLDFRVRRLLEEARVSIGPSTRFIAGSAAGLLIIAQGFGAAMHWTVQALTRLP